MIGQFRALAGDVDALFVVAVIALATTGLGHSSAAELSILLGGAAKNGLQTAIPGFEMSESVTVKGAYAPMGRLLKSLSDGATPDIVVVTEDVLADVTAKGSWQNSAASKETA